MSTPGADRAANHTAPFDWARGIQYMAILGGTVEPRATTAEETAAIGESLVWAGITPEVEDMIDAAFPGVSEETLQGIWTGIVLSVRAAGH